MSDNNTCQYCGSRETDNLMHEELERGHVEIYFSENVFKVETYEEGYGYEYHELRNFRYCPCCGRKLISEG